jgi:sugar-specific transcriptional regulator TrmB
MDFKEQYKQYEIKINELKSQYATAEKQAIVAETNLTNLRNNKEHLIEECEAFTGVSIDKVPEVLKQKKEELENIMSKLLAINIDTTEIITQEKIDSIKNIIDEFSINIVE